MSQALGTRPPRSLVRPTAGLSVPPGLRRNAPGLCLAALGVAVSMLVHDLVPAIPTLTAAMVLGIAAAHVPAVRTLTQGIARPGLSVSAKRLMRVAIVLLGLQLSLSDVLGLGWLTALMVLGVVLVTFTGTLWMGRKLGLPGDQPLLVATGYSICGASAIGAVSQTTRSDERDVANAVAVVTLCGTLAIGVLPLLHHPLGLGDAAFGRWVGASVHDVGQVVAAAQTAGPAALKEAVLVKLMRVAMLAPLVAIIAVTVRRRATAAPSEEGESTKRPPLLPLFVAGFLVMILLRTTGRVPESLLGSASNVQHLLLAAALFGLGSSIHLPSMTRTGGRMAVLGLASWVVIAGLSYAGTMLTT
ncbi:putative sulfate exporter family transporter [Actinomadura barringtoniae]|uniref:Sulfate exporter family transporter n=1 Tax=Actinomadura barringtoniae TaxID=1427535 RepID=A0A939T7C1_9ACTN|nr:putative sulfate exporter family transporter [Actinomadura barringtoniae]MBO2452948.1 putative sulfate exporter family transporter [Actinomadura barringtoniae]